MSFRCWKRGCVSGVLIVAVVKDVMDASLMSAGLEGVEVDVGVEGVKLTV